MDVNNKKIAKIFDSTFLFKLWADLAPIGDAKVEIGAIKIKPIKLTYPKDPGGRPSTLNPVTIKNNVPGIAK